MRIGGRDLATTAAIALLGVAVLSWGSDGFTAFTAEAARRRQVLAEPRPLPAVGLEDQDGRRFSFADYAGRLLAVEFVYTRCDTVCYSLGAAFKQIRESVPAHRLGRDFALLSVSFDPVRDDPPRLREYAGRFGADGVHWRIARPADAGELAALLAAFGVVVVPDGLGGFEHNAAIHLVGRDGRLRRIADLDAVDAFVAGLERET
ncbi:MAG: SCO family protein [Rhodocyclaceae bacterium]|nr:SCO family protein [Rhodocyclaceae bacterium]